MKNNRELREVHPPSMDALLNLPGAVEAEKLYGREAIKEELRRAIGMGGTDPRELLSSARRALDGRFAPTLLRAINATGVLLHTNLGRSPLSDPAREALLRIAAGYSTLEYDPGTGGRGHRQSHVRSAARDLFGSQDAIAVNNNASAIFLCLSALARGRRVLVSRGELVAIGGSFKIPEILEASGAVLAEVGTTNRTSIEDYRRALSSETALLLTVHPSNYEIRGYTQRPEVGQIATLAREAGIPWVHDQGTGCVVPLDEFGVAAEPTVASCLAGGADLVTFSADKLFAGPQAGFVAWRALSGSTSSRSRRSQRRSRPGRPGSGETSRCIERPVRAWIVCGIVARRSGTPRAAGLLPWRWNWSRRTRSSAAERAPRSPYLPALSLSLCQVCPSKSWRADCARPSRPSSPASRRAACCSTCARWIRTKTRC